MDITVNGEKKEIIGDCSVAGLLERLGLEPRKIAVERNRAVVPKSQYSDIELADGDQIEIVQFVGGG